MLNKLIKEFKEDESLLQEDKRKASDKYEIIKYQDEQIIVLGKILLLQNLQNSMLNTLKKELESGVEVVGIFELIKLLGLSDE